MLFLLRQRGVYYINFIIIIFYKEFITVCLIMNYKKITEANREAWNEVTPIHQKNRKENLKELFKQKGFSTLDKIITDKLMNIGLDGKSAGQLCCNNGRETLSLLNLGVKTAVGFDISDEAIKEARELAEIAGLKCGFVCSDVYDIAPDHFGKYDLIFITIGALSWLPDLHRFFGIVSKMLKPRGELVIYEQHPFLYVFATEGDDEYDPEIPNKIAFSYFRKEPWADDCGIDYIGKTTYDAKTNYSYTQTVSDIINAIVKNGISLDEFIEYPHDITEIYDKLENGDNLPRCYIISGHKE